MRHKARLIKKNALQVRFLDWILNLGPDIPKSYFLQQTLSCSWVYAISWPESLGRPSLMAGAETALALLSLIPARVTSRWAHGVCRGWINAGHYTRIYTFSSWYRVSSSWARQDILVHTDRCCFHYYTRYSLLTLLKSLFARILYIWVLGFVSRSSHTFYFQGIE